MGKGGPSMFQSDGSMEPAGRGDADEGPGYDEVDNVPREWYAYLLFWTFSSIIRPFLEVGLLILYMFHPPVLLIKTSRLLSSRLNTLAQKEDSSNFACKSENARDNLVASFKLNLLEIIFRYSVSLSPTKKNFIYWSRCAFKNYRVRVRVRKLK